MATKTWKLAGGGAWTTSTNWVEGSVPGTGDDVILTTTTVTTNNITAVPDITLNSISCANGSGVSTRLAGASPGKTITITNTTATAALTMSGAGNLQFGSNGSGGQVNLIINQVTTATVLTAGGVSILSYASLTINAGTTLTVNGTTFQVSAGTSSTCTNSGTITLTSGTITCSGTYVHNQDGGTVPAMTCGTGTVITISGLITTTCTIGTITAGTLGTFNLTCANLTSPVTVTLPTSQTITNVNLSGTDATNRVTLQGVASSTVLVTNAIEITQYSTLSNGAGNWLFAGLVTIDAGGICSFSNNGTLTFRNGIANSGTFTQSGTGAVQFNTNNQAISGTVSFAGVIAVSGTSLTVTNNGTVNSSNQLTGSASGSTWIQGNNSVLNYGHATQPMTTGTLTLTGTNNTVNYNKAGTQAINISNSYVNLILSGSGNKTAASTLTTTGLLTISGTAVLSTSHDVAINGTTVCAGGTINATSSSTVTYATTALYIIGGTYYNLTVNSAYYWPFCGAVSITHTPTFLHNIKTVNGIAAAHIKSVNGIAWAHVKEVNGVFK